MPEPTTFSGHLPGQTKNHTTHTNPMTDLRRLEILDTQITNYEEALKAATAATAKLHTVRKQQQELAAKRTALLADVASDPDKALDPNIKKRLADANSDLELLAAALEGLAERAGTTEQTVTALRNAPVQTLDHLCAALRRRFVKMRGDEVQALVDSWGAKAAPNVSIFTLYRAGIESSCSVCVEATAFQGHWTGQQPHVAKLREACAFLNKHKDVLDKDEDSMPAAVAA